jgi:hypothetical protein
LERLDDIFAILSFFAILIPEAYEKILKTPHEVHNNIPEILDIPKTSDIIF